MLDRARRACTYFMRDFSRNLVDKNKTFVWLVDIVALVTFRQVNF